MALTTFYQSDVPANVISGNPYNGETDHANILALAAHHLQPYVPTEQQLYFDTGTAKNILLIQVRPDQEYDWRNGAFNIPINVIEGSSDCDITHWYAYRIDNDGQKLGLIASGGYVGIAMTTGVKNLPVTLAVTPSMPADELLFVFRGKADTSNTSITILPDREFTPSLYRVVRGRLCLKGTGAFVLQPMPRLYWAGVGETDFSALTRLLWAGVGGFQLTPDWISAYVPFDQVVVLYSPIEGPIDLSDERLPDGFSELETGQPVGTGELSFPFLWGAIQTGPIEPCGPVGPVGLVQAPIPPNPVYLPKSRN